MGLATRWAPTFLMTHAILSAVSSMLWSLGDHWERGLANAAIAIVAYGFACIIHQARKECSCD